MKENRIIYDWLSFTTKKHSLEDIKLMLGLSSKKWLLAEKGRFFYTRSLSYGHIKIYFGTPTNLIKNGVDMGVHVELSGQGCREFETEGSGDYKHIFEIILKNSEQMNLTRLDVAFDDFASELPLADIEKDFLEQNFKSTCKAINNKIFKNIAGGLTISHGGRGQEIFVRIYNKQAEQNVEFSWVRCEVEMRGDTAKGFISCLYEEGLEIGFAFKGVLNSKVSYLKKGIDSNKSRWDIAPYWLKFLGYFYKIKVSSKELFKIDFSKVLKHVRNQAKPLRAFLEVMGLRELISMIYLTNLDETKYELFLDRLKAGLEIDKEKYALHDYSKLENYYLKNGLKVSDYNQLDFLGV